MKSFCVRKEFLIIERVKRSPMKKIIAKKIIAILLAATMVVTYFPTMVFAEGDGEQPAMESGQNVQEPEESTDSDIQDTDAGNGATHRTPAQITLYRILMS